MFVFTLSNTGSVTMSCPDAGHSQGAGVATLVYLYLLIDKKYSHLRSALLKGGVYAFGCPGVILTAAGMIVKNYLCRVLSLDQ